MLINLVYLIELLNIDNTDSLTNSLYIFFSSSLFYSKLIITFVSIYLFSYVITPKGDYSLYTLRMFNYKRSEALINKIISVSIIIFIFVLLSLLCFLIFLLIGFKVIINVNEYLIAYINTYLLALNYGMIGLILMQLINNYFVMIVTCVINLFISGIEDLEGISKIIMFVLPKLTETGVSVYGTIHLIWLLFVYICIGYIIYKKRDLNY